MKSIVIAFLLLNTASHLQAQQYFQTQYPKVWVRTAAYTLALAEQMPEDQYGFRPAEGAMSFGEQLLHIVDNISFLTRLISDESKIFYDREKTEELKKDQIIEILENANNYVGKLIAEISPDGLNADIEFRKLEMSKENIFYLLRDHQVHHRGQCVVYLRMAGVKAPSYVGW